MKYPDSIYTMNIYDEDWTIDSVIDAFKKSPYLFEYFCADIFENMGYAVDITPSSNDGGYDLLLKNRNDIFLVECKCFDLHNKVGRPILQKLVGVNALLHATGLIVVTTSCFSKAAIKYAREIGMNLIDGMRLELLVRRFFEQ